MKLHGRLHAASSDLHYAWAMKQALPIDVLHQSSNPAQIGWGADDVGIGILCADGGNQAVQDKLAWAQKQRDAGKSTIPSTIQVRSRALHQS